MATADEILSNAEKLADQFEAHEPDPDNVRDARPLREVRDAYEAKVRAEQALADAVSVARAEGHSWALIGTMIGTTGEAARQRYGKLVVGRA